VLPGRFAERPVFVTLDDRSGSIAPLRFLNPRTFDQLFMLAGVPVFPVRFGDFLAALAASSYVCCALTPVIPGVSFLGYEWRELAGSSPSFGLDVFTDTKEAVELDFSLVSPHQWVSYKLKWRRAFRTMSLRRRSDSGEQPSGRIE
jgi:hypothetical protein